jgi:hypothetical protein
MKINNPKTHALNVISGPFFYIVSPMTFPWDLHKYGIDYIIHVCTGRDSSVGTATSYDLDVPELEFR